LQKRIGLLTSPKIIPLALWARTAGMAGNIAANKAARSTIPAFRIFTLAQQLQLLIKVA
jgi:hypothetical protein